MKKPTYTQPPPNLSSQFTTPTNISKFPFLPSKKSKLLLCSTNSNQEPTFFKILKTIPEWADQIQESGMKKKRSLYTHENWVQHRSSFRHVRHFVSSLTSRVVLSLVPPVISFTTVAVIVATYNTAVWFDWLPEFFPTLRASSLPYQLTAPALALLLVFRTEASYSRFDTGKKAWTRVVSGTNDFARQVIGSVKSPNDAVLRNAILHYIMAFPVALKCHITNGSDIARDLENLLDSDDLEVVLSSNHHPRCIIEFISQSLQLLDVDTTKRQALESKLSCFHEGIGLCEQLMGIPIPLSYTRLTSRFLVLWHFTLPIILWDDCHWIVVPATFISAASLFCIEEVGVLIEEPFPMLPLDELCDFIRSNIQDVLRSEKLIQARVSAKRMTRHNEHSPNGRPTVWKTENLDKNYWRPDDTLEDTQPG